MKDQNEEYMPPYFAGFTNDKFDSPYHAAERYEAPAVVQAPSPIASQYIL